MNTNELIEISRARIDVLKDCLENDVYAGKREANEIDYHQSIIAALSHTRIRETAKEPPTLKNTDKYGFVLACYRDTGEWETVLHQWIDEDPDNYTKWTELPKE